MSISNRGKALGKIALGGLAIAIGIQFFLVPNQLIIGGISGLAIMINYITGLPTGLSFFIINAIVFLFALRQFGVRFILVCLFGVAVTSILVDTIAFLGFVATQELILATVFGGLLIGVGVGLILSAGSCSSGVDMMARLLREKRPNLSFGYLILCIDGVIIIIGALVFRQIDLALYAIIAVYILKRAVDYTLSRTSAQ